jgi:16S rRNA (uracil1498-N3)-methyltransferase
MPRFFCPQPLVVGDLLTLPDAVAHHLHVLRQQPGDVLTLFNGVGGEYVAELTSIEKRRATVAVKSFIEREAELPYAVTLAQALPEASKMDWIIEKAMEMGVAAIVPLAAQRCVVRLSGERAEKRQAHWQGVIEAAAEQSGRNRLARLGAVENLHGWLAKPLDQPRILLSPRGAQSLSAWAQAQAPQPLTLMIGPEGGFTEQEEDAAIALGALALGMGPRILRTETAGIAALGILTAHWGA